MKLCKKCSQGEPKENARFDMGKCDYCGEYTGLVDSRDIKKDYDLPPGFEELFNPKK